MPLSRYASRSDADLAAYSLCRSAYGREKNGIGVQLVV